MLCTSEIGLECLLGFDRLGVKGGMDRAVLQDGGRLAVCTRVETSWTRQGHDVNDMEERLVVEFDVFVLTRGRHLMGDWAMIQKECVWDNRYVGGCEVTGVSGNSVEALVKGEVTTYPHRLHRRGLLGTTDLCADWYQAVRDGEDSLAAAIAAAAADEGAAQCSAIL